MADELVTILRARAEQKIGLGVADGEAGIRYDVDLMRRAAERIESLLTPFKVRGLDALRHD